MNENMFARRMRETRIKKGISQAELSRITGIAPATLSSYESEDKPKSPPIDKALTIANALNVSLDWLCGLNSDKCNNTSNEITFDNIMEAIMLLASLKQVSFSTLEKYANELEYSVIPTIEMDSQILKKFIVEYQKVSEFIETADYDDYLKDGLKKAIINKFKDYIVSEGVIQSKNDGAKDSIVPADNSDIPF